MTFDDLKAAVKGYVNLTSPEADTRVGQAINRHYRRITSLIGMDATRFVTRSASTTVGVRTVTFESIEKIDRILDTTDSTAIRLIQEVSQHAQRSTQPGASQPSTWALQNTDATSVTVLFDTVPQTAYSVQADGWTSLADLTGTDSPAFPESFHDILVWFVTAEEMLKKEKDKIAGAYEARAEKLLAELRFHLADSPTRETRQGSSTISTLTSGASGGSGGSLGATAYTQSALVTYDRGAGVAPFAVAQATAATVANLSADKLDDEDGTFYLDRANHTGTDASTSLSLSATDRLIGRDTAGAGVSEEIAVTNGLAFTGAQSIGVANDGITYARMQNVSAASRLLGRGSAAGSGDPEELTVSTGLTLSGTALSNAHAANQSANTVLAGPTTGAATTPTFRALVIADITSILPAALYNVGAYHATTQSISDSTATAVTYNSEDYTTGALHSTSTNPTHFTAATTGHYGIDATCAFDPSATGFRWMWIRKNGTTVVSGSVSQQGQTSFQNHLCLSAKFPLTATDYVEVMVEQTSGGSLNIGHAATREFQNSVQFARLG